jgi:hypothetical protein
MEERYTNELEICVVALWRSGHHAVIQWILRHLSGRGCFMNDCDVGRSPFATECRDDADKRHLARGVDLAAEEPGRLSHKDYLVFNFEHEQLTEVFSPAFLARRDTLTGASRRRLHVVVLRDPFNNFASLLRWARAPRPGRLKPKHSDVAGCGELWKSYARELLDETHIVPSERILVRYNDWLTDDAYRAEIAAAIGFTATDAGLDRVAPWGANTWGESFDGLAYDGRAREMDLLQRFRHYEDDAVYRSFFDEELLELSRLLFGEIPGTERLAEAVRRPRAGKSGSRR